MLLGRGTTQPTWHSKNAHPKTGSFRCLPKAATSPRKSLYACGARRRVSWGMREWSRKQQKCTKTWEKPVICKEYPWSFKMFKGMVFWGSKFFLLLLSQGIPLIWKAGESSWSFPSSFKITPKSWVTKKKTGPLLNPWNPVCSNPGSWFHALWNNIYLTG